MADIDELRAAIRKIENGEAACHDAGGSSNDDPVESRQTQRKDNKRQEERADGSKAFGKIVRLLSATEKSSGQLRERLLRDGFSEDAAQEALDRAIQCGIVDDSRYAAWLVRGRIKQGRGLRGIEHELANIGFELSDVPGWPEDFDYEDNEVDRALAFLDAHPPKAKNIRDSAYRKLVSKGFSSDSASSAARIWCEKKTAE